MQAPVYDPEGDTKRRSDKVASPGHNPGADHERNMLEGMYNAPSATNSGEKQIGRKNLANMENNDLHNKGVGAFKSEKDGLSKFGAGQKEAVADKLGKGYTGGPTKNTMAERKKSRKRRVLAGWAVGLVLSGGIGSGILGILGGQFQFIHSAQLMQQLHLEDPENEGDSFMMKVARYVRYADTPEKTRLGILGNKYADQIESKFNTNGLQSAYTPNFGYLDGYVLDKSQFKGGAFDEVANKSDAQVKKYFRETYNVDVVTKNGKLYVDAVQLKYRANLRFMDGVLRDAGARRVVSSVQIRVAATRGGISFHPIKRIDEKILRTVDARLAKWNENLKERIAKGSTAAKITTSNDADKDNKDASKNASDLDAETQGVLDEAAGADSKGAIATLRETLSFKVAAGGAALVSVLCIGHVFAVSYDDTQQTQVVEPLKRVGGEMIAVGNQAALGGAEAEGQLAEQLGFYQTRMYNKDDGTSWSDAESIRSELGQEGGKDINSGAKLKGNPFEIFKNIPGIDTVCSTGGQIGALTISLIGGPISTVIGAVAGYVFGPPIINAITDWLADAAVDLGASGALWGNYMNYGTRLLANDGETSTGGVPVDNSEEISRKVITMKQNQVEFQQHSIAYRLFNLEDRRSLAGSFLDKQKPDATANIASMFRGIFNFGSTLTSIPKSLLTDKALAANVTYDYGFKKVLHPSKQIDDPNLQNPYENECIVVGSEKAGCVKSNYGGILQGDKGDDYMKRADKCFGVQLNDDGDVTPDTSSPPNQKDVNSAECADSDEDWQRVSMYIAYRQTMEAWACRYGNNEACTNVSFNGAST